MKILYISSRRTINPSVVAIIKTGNPGLSLIIADETFLVAGSMKWDSCAACQKKQSRQLGKEENKFRGSNSNDCLPIMLAFL